MYRDVLLMMSGASMTSFLEGDNDGSAARRSKLATASRYRGIAKPGETSVTLEGLAPVAPGMKGRPATSEAWWAVTSASLAETLNQPIGSQP